MESKTLKTLCFPVQCSTCMNLLCLQIVVGFQFPESHVTTLTDCCFIYMYSCIDVLIFFRYFSYKYF